VERLILVTDVPRNSVLEPTASARVEAD